MRPGPLLVCFYFRFSTVVLPPQQGLARGEGVLGELLVEVDSSISSASKSSPSSREARRKSTPRSVSTTASYSSAPHHSGSGGYSHSSTGTPLRRTASRPAHDTGPSASRSSRSSSQSIDAPHAAAPTKRSIGLGVADVLGWLCRLSECAPSGLAAQEPLADHLDGGPSPW
jgi:hypothetical protein